MKQLMRLTTTLLIAVGTVREATCGASPTAGDRHPSINCIYPLDVFLHDGKGGLVVDVTKAPFNAKGDAVTDDTAAIIAAYDYCLEVLDTTRWSLPKGQDNHISPYIYFPNGVYLVSDTIVYSDPERAGWNLIPVETQKLIGRKGTGIWDGEEGVVDFHFYNMAREYHPMKGMNKNEHLARIRLIGQSRDGTIIRLKENSQGFGSVRNSAGRSVLVPKPVISYGKSCMNNHVAQNELKNLTIEVQPGNPGAVGVEFMGANNCHIGNTTIRSVDGQGVAGIRFRITPTQGYHTDITVDGFDYGIQLSGFHVTHPAIEHVTLTNQRQAGISIQNSSASLRSICSENDVPALLLDAPAAYAAIIDSCFASDGGAEAAIEVKAGTLFARNITTKGYIAAAKAPTDVHCEEPHIDELVTGQVFSARKVSQPRSLNLPIKDMPRVHWEQDLEQWANVVDFGAKADGQHDDSSAIQASLNSGRSTIYFPWGNYVSQQPLAVPATVKRILGMYHEVNLKLVVKEFSNDPLVIEECCGADVDCQSARTLVMRNCSSTNVHSSNEAAPDVFAAGVSGCSFKETKNMSIWGRGLNPEGQRLPLTARAGSKFWVFGFKMERGLTGAAHLTSQVDEAFKGNPMFLAEADSQLEVLGGVGGVHNKAFLVNHGGTVSVTCATGTRGALRGNAMAEPIVDFVEDKALVIGRDELPVRAPKSSAKLGWNITVPLYVNNSNTKVRRQED